MLPTVKALLIPLFTAILTAGGCVAVVPAQKAPDLAPRPVKASLPIGLNPLLFNLDRNAVVGGEAEDGSANYDVAYEWKENFKLKRHAFAKPLREELLANGFRFAVGSKATYQLKATVEHLVFNLFGENGAGRGEAEVTVLWAFEGPNGLEVRTRGFATSDRWGKDALYQAFRASLRNFLAREDVVARFAPKGMMVAEPVAEPANPGKTPEPEAVPDPPRPAALDRPVDRVKPAASKLGEEALDDRTRPSVVTLLSRDRWSSGVVVSRDGLVITSSRLVKGVAYVNLVLHDGETRPAKVLMVDEEAEVALVQAVASGRFKPMAIRLEPLTDGEAVAVYGTPYHPALSHSTVRGAVSGHESGRATATTKVIAGNAGGPIVDELGRAAGIVTWDREATAAADDARIVPMKRVFEALRLNLRD